MRRPQFSIRTLLVATLVVAVFFGGMAVQRQLDKPASRYTTGFVDESSTRYVETMVMKDGTEWSRELGPILDN
jgi:hypothetical protein